MILHLARMAGCKAMQLRHLNSAKASRRFFACEPVGSEFISVRRFLWRRWRWKDQKLQIVDVFKVALGEARRSAAIVAKAPSYRLKRANWQGVSSAQHLETGAGRIERRDVLPHGIFMAGLCGIVQIQVVRRSRLPRPYRDIDSRCRAPSEDVPVDAPHQNSVNRFVRVEGATRTVEAVIKCVGLIWLWTDVTPAHEQST